MGRRVLVMCHANRFRSPLAAAMLKRCYPEGEIRSAGFMEGGKRAGKSVREAAQLLGLDLTGHFSTCIDLALLQWAEYVVLMNETHMLKLRLHIAPPTKGQKRVLLGHYASPPVPGIPDLGFIQKGTPKFTEVVGMIDGAVRELAQELRK